MFFHAEGRADGQTDIYTTKLIVTFRNFANATKMQQTEISEVTTAVTMNMTVFCLIFSYIFSKLRRDLLPPSLGILKTRIYPHPWITRLLHPSLHRYLQETTCEAEHFGNSILQPINKLVLSPYTSFNSQDQVTTEVGLPTVTYSRCHSLRKILSAAHYN
jgi:hypothetical protein